MTGGRLRRLRGSFGSGPAPVVTNAKSHEGGNDQEQTCEAARCSRENPADGIPKARIASKHIVDRYGCRSDKRNNRAASPSSTLTDNSDRIHRDSQLRQQVRQRSSNSLRIVPPNMDSSTKRRINVFSFPYFSLLQIGQWKYSYVIAPSISVDCCA